MLPPSLSSPSVHHGVVHQDNVRQKTRKPSTEIDISWRNPHRTIWPFLGGNKNGRTKHAAVQGCQMSQSVSENVASQDAVGGQHVKRGVGVVIRGPDVVAICPPVAAISAPKTISRLCCHSGIGPFGLADANGFNVAVVEQRGRVGFPAVVEVPRFTRTIIKSARREVGVARTSPCLQPVVFNNVGLQ